MASAVSNSSQGTHHRLQATGRALFVGLVWGGLMLLVFGFWMRSKYEGGQRLYTNILLGAAAVTAALALWEAFTLWFKKEAPEQQSASLAQQHRILSYFLLGAGFGLVVLAFLLGMSKGSAGSFRFSPDNFAESFGAMVFGLIALCSGYWLQQPENEAGITVEFLVAKVPVLKMSQLVIGVLALGTLLYLFVTKREGGAYLNWLPEIVILLFTSMLCLACFLFLNSGIMDEAGVRLFVLIFGGAGGLILFLWAVFRTYVWRNDILLGGTVAWQGENAWHFWLCAYGMFLALAIMFFSFSLGKADIRTNAVLRRVMYGYDAVVQGLLLVGILGISNIVIYALVPYTFDWTKSRGAYSLSESSKNVITGLKEETNVFVLVSQNSFIYKDLRVLLDNCHALNSRFKVNYISPDVDDTRYGELAEMFPKIIPEGPGAGGKGVLIVYGPIPKKKTDKKPPNSFVAEKKLMDVDQMARMRNEKPKVTFKGEEEIIKEVDFLTQGEKQRKLYFLQGNDEVDINNMEGFDRVDLRASFGSVGVGFLVSQLKKDNYDVSGLSFGVELKGQNIPNMTYAPKEGKDGRKEVPGDCHTLILAGATKDLPKDTLDAVERYLARGGKMLVFLDFALDESGTKLQESNLEPLLKRHGVEVSQDLALRFTQDPNDDPRVLFVTTPLKSDNPLGQQFVNRRINFKRLARVVQPVEGPGRFKAEVILEQKFNPRQTDRYTVLEKNLNALKDLRAFMNDIREDQAKFQVAIHTKSVPFAVAVSEGEKPRMVVFGDTDFITNREIVTAMRQRGLMNYDFVASSLEWMAERKKIGSQPKAFTPFSLSPEVNISRMIVLPGWLMLLGLIGLGACIWVVRRR